MAIDSGMQPGKIYLRDEVDLDGGALCSKLQKFTIQGGSIVRSALFGKPKRFVELPIRMLSLQPIAFFGIKRGYLTSRAGESSMLCPTELVKMAARDSRQISSQILDGRLPLFVVISTFKFRTPVSESRNPAIATLVSTPQLQLQQ